MDYVIVGDWGTSNLRLHLVSGAKSVESKSGLGVKSVQGNAKEYLYSLCEDWIKELSINEVSLCGMAGSRIGIIETEYLSTTLTRDKYFENFASFEVNGAIFKQSAGVKCVNFNDYPDVMRGEEMQIFGAVDKLSGDRNLLILPGTHSKWVMINHGAIEQFQTYPSGELFDLLQNHSTMGNKDAEFNPLGFKDGIDFRIRNNGLLGSIFAARSFQLIDGKNAEWAKGFLSGMIIADEVLENKKLAANYSEVTLIGARKLCESYAVVLERLSIKPKILDGDECAIAGLLQFSENRRSK